MRMRIKEAIERDGSIEFKTKHGSIYLSKTKWDAIFYTVTFAFPHKKKLFSSGLDIKDLIGCYLYAHKGEDRSLDENIKTILVPGN